MIIGLNVGGLLQNLEKCFWYGHRTLQIR